MATKTVLETQRACDSFDGIAFRNMSDSFLLECYDTLCERTALINPNHEDWLDEWDSCKRELMARLRAGSEAIHDGK